MEYLKFVWYFSALPGTKRAERRVKKVLGDLRDLRSHWVAYRQELLKDRNEKVAKDVLATVKSFDRLIGRRTLVARNWGY
ncbi:MAG: hypothetical protein HY813_03375 [Candidatus Portnoybacteria bacterium]|nr:hypothetical protein [Candidatus Portnoybacteria bacterium]